MLHVKHSQTSMLMSLCRMQLQLSFTQSSCPCEGLVRNSIQGVRGARSVTASIRGERVVWSNRTGAQKQTVWKCLETLLLIL